MYTTHVHVWYCVCLCVDVVTSAALTVIGELHELHTLTIRDCPQLTDDVLLAVSCGCTQLRYLYALGVVFYATDTGPTGTLAPSHNLNQ